MRKVVRGDIVIYADTFNVSSWHTAAGDTETFVYLDDEKKTLKEMYAETVVLPVAELRKRVTTRVWLWQIYDEINGFFATNDFETFMTRCAAVGYHTVWFYNARFDFSQIDYQILTSLKWKRHEKGGNTRGQKWTYESLHNDTGCRYSYKFWVPYKNKDRHEYTRTFDFRDFMNLYGGGLKKVLESLNVTDNDGNAVRKTEMEYNDVDEFNLSESEMIYVVNDVKGLYFAVKKYNEQMETLSDGECRIFGRKPNIMTAGGFAKRELLRYLYPNLQPQKRVKKYQRTHPVTIDFDKFCRENHLYQGGRVFVNPRYIGKFLTRKMLKYDVNSEYPAVMAELNDLYGYPKNISMRDYQKLPNKSAYECIYICQSIRAEMRENMIPIWYNVESKKYESSVVENVTHLIFKDEYEELSNWYDIEAVIKRVIIVKKGDKIYAPYILSNYERKQNATDSAERAVAKLHLNSSYGKLAERIERETGEYELNEDGCVRFKLTGTEVNDAGRMSILVGAKITSNARIMLMRYIRNICANPSEQFVYCDTDSIHAFVDEYGAADSKRLGAVKLEMTARACKYLAPKTYIDIGVDGVIELHSKGISSRFLKSIIDGTSDAEICKRFAYDTQFECLQALNVVGGKALVGIKKYLAVSGSVIANYGNFNLIEEL